MIKTRILLLVCFALGLLYLPACFFFPWRSDECQTNGDCRGRSTKQVERVCTFANGAKLCLPAEPTPDAGNNTTPDAGNNTTPDRSTQQPNQTTDREPIIDCYFPPMYGERCGRDQPCAEGLVCVTDAEEQSGTCFRDCTQKGDETCKGGQDIPSACAKVQISSKTTVHVCVANNVQKGETCGPSNKHALCQDDPSTPYPDLYCDPTTEKCIGPLYQSTVGAPCDMKVDGSGRPMLCDPNKNLKCGPDGTCTEYKIVDTYKKCGYANFFCKSNEICYHPEDSVAYGFCMPRCSVAANSCPSKSRCVAISATSNDGACLPYGPKQINETCQPHGDLQVEPYDVGQSCGASMTCLKTSPQSAQGLCVPALSSCKNGTCQDGRFCITLPNGQGACVGPCTVDEDCKKLDASAKCTTPQGGSSYCTLP
ncbi:MAG: hypothetical protein H6728_08370 [Myxococcales bacterium]|nr:hypothetical protein [Myxococcales bacterium]